MTVLSVLSVVFQVVTASFGTGAIVLAWKTWRGRSKVKADNAVTLSDAAIRQVNDMQADLLTAQTEIRNFRRALVAHGKWDRLVLKRLQQLGVDDIPDPPELWI